MKTINPHEVARQVTLALVLEPLAEKQGCTTRTFDLSEHIRLQHLQSAGVNVARYFYELAKRVEENKGIQPALYFDLAFAALNDSQKNLQNAGKYINQGLITMFFHVVVSSLVTDGDGIAVCKNVPEVLKRSSQQDAYYRNKFRLLVVSTSRKESKRNFPSIEAENLCEYYEQSMIRSKEVQYLSGVIWSEELLAGLPMVQAMFMEAKKHIDQGLIVAMEKCYETGVRLLPIESPGFVADYVGVVVYLLLRESGEKPIIH